MERERLPIIGPFTVVVAPDLAGAGWRWRVFVPDVMDVGSGWAHSQRAAGRQARQRVRDARRGGYHEIHP